MIQMPIIGIQRRLRQAGRIRIGAKVATKNGGSRPSKLDAFRFTSPDQSVIQAVADVYGGEVQIWDGASVGTQWEVYTKATEFDIIVPPTDIAFSQWFELWAGAGCQRRCDGVTNILTDAPCLCDPEKMECKPTTRLNVILSAIEGIGVFRLESHGFNSAAELGGSIEVLKTLQARGAMVPGRLMLEQRQSKRIDQATGKAEVFNFAVPVLDFRLNVAAIAAGESGRVAAVTPIQSEAPALTSVADQIQAVSTPTERPKRANSAAPLPSTGLKPRGMSTTIEPETTKAPVADKTPGGASTRSMRRLMALVNGIKTIENDDDRYAWATVALNKEVKSFNDLDQSEVNKLMDVAEGKTPLVPDESQKLYSDDDNERPF